MAEGNRSQHDIGDLVNAQRGIESDKITERKKWANTLRELLESAYIIDYIDSNSASEAKPKFRGSGVTWTTLFRSVVAYISKEVEGIAKLEDKGAQSSSAYTSRQTKKKDVGDMFRAYVRAANKQGKMSLVPRPKEEDAGPGNKAKGGPHLIIREVLNHMTSVLEWKMGAWLCMDYTQTLLHYILPQPHYVLQMNSQTWEDLLDLYCQLFLSPHPSYDRTLLAKIIHTIVSLSSSQCDIPADKLYSFFTRAFENINHEKNHKVLEHLLASLNIFSTVAAVNARGRLCKLGEDIFLHILHLWSKCQPALKDQVVEFLRIQVRVHHPQGTHTDEEGAWATNDDLWKRNLERLYDQILSDFEAASHRLRWTGKAETSQKPELIDLAADTVQQVLYLRDGSGLSMTADPMHPRVGKRPKVQSGWATLRDHLGSNQDNPALVLWLQLLVWLLSKWPSSLPSEEVTPLLVQLHKMQAEAKRPESVRWLFACLNVLAMNPSTLSTLTSTRDLWHQVWLSTLKTVSVHTAEEQGYTLLTTLVEQRLVECDLEPWKLLNAAVNLPTRPVVSFLSSILRHHPLPESLHPTLTTPTATPTNCYPLRSQLLQFLLPTSEVRGRGGGGRETHLEGAGNGLPAGMIKLANRPPVVVMAHILVSLTQRSCGSIHLPFLKQMYHQESTVAFAREVLDPGGSMDEFERQLTSIEQIYLESTFDVPLSLPHLHSGDNQPTSLSRENTIGVLQALLLDLLAKRAELLLQPIDVEGCLTPREQAQQLACLVEAQAYHCCLLAHVLLLLCHCEAFTHADQLRKTPAMRSLPELLKRISLVLKDTVWNSVEKPVYYLTTQTVLETLRSLVQFSHLKNSRLSPSVSKAIQVVTKVCTLSLPAEFFDTISKLAQGKWPPPILPMAPSVSGSAFSLGGSSLNSRPPSVADSRGFSPTFDDEMDLGMADSGPSVQSEPSGTNMIGPTDIVSTQTLNEKTAAQLEAAVFLCHWYGATVSTPGGTSDSDGTNHCQAGGVFDTQTLLLSMLSEEFLELSKPVSVQMVFKICEVLAASCSHDKSLHVEILGGLLEVLGQVLNIHRNNQCVYRESLRVLTLLAPHCGTTSEDSSVREQCMTILSGFWNLYCEGILHASVRVELARFVQACFEVDPGELWTTIVVRKKKKREITEDHVSPRKALVTMVNDTHHAVRMHMARVVLSLYLGDRSSQALLPRPVQEETFQEVSKMLETAHMVTTSQDELSAEDDSVNRVASMITTLQYEACTSPVCERGVVSVLMTAVGKRHIDEDLVSKALSQVAAYLGYSSLCAFLETMLVSLVSSWLEDGFQVDDFPFRLLGFSNKEHFFKSYAHLILPHLVYLADKPSLASLSNLLHSPLPDLLQPSLPACMVLILTGYAQQSSEDSEEGGRERRARATTSHNLLTQHLTEEVVAQTIQFSIDEFVVELLVRLCEPHTAETHLAKFCKPSDPEPCPPHYTSLAIRATLDYMPRCYGNTAIGTSFVRLLSRRKDYIQKILLSLSVRIESTHRPFEKRRLFLAYCLFVSLICKELRDGLEGTQPFVVMDTIHTVVRILTKPEGKEREGILKELFGPCCDVLLTLCQATLEACPNELTKHLHTIVVTLVPFAQQQSTEAKQALTVLKFLILKAESEVLAEHVALLDPFPPTEPFSKLRQKQAKLKELMGAASLSEEIQRFLSLGQECPHSSRREGLKALQVLLHTTWLDISCLIQRDPTPVVNLIQGLVGLCQDASGGDGGSGGVCGEVGRCLGEIGPIDLRCIALPTERNSQSSFNPSTLPTAWSYNMRYTAKILHSLASLLSDKNIEVVRASGECLRGVLATRTGGQVLGKLEEICLEDGWHLYLEPFKPQKKRKSSSSTSQPLPLPSLTSFSTLVDVPELWLPSNHSSHHEWVTQLVTTIISSGGVTDEVLLLLKPVCQVQVQLCEEVFPLLIRDILSTEREDFRNIISRQIRLFFSTVTSSPYPSSPSPPSHSPPHTHPNSIRTMLNMVMYLRTADRPKKTRGPNTPWENNFWLDLDFLDVAKAAQLCSAYFTSLLCIEIWHGATRDVAQNSCYSSSGEEHAAMEVDPIRPPSLSSQTSTLDDPSVQQLLMEAYSRIGEPDSLYGACATHSFDETTRVRMYEHEGQWQRSLSAYNLQMQLPGATCQSSLVQSLHNLGLTHVLCMYICGGTMEDQQCTAEMAEYRYEAAWRCSMWENMETSSLQVAGSQGGYHQSVYSCLTALKDGESNLLQSSLADARSKVIGSLCSSGLESAYSLYPSLSKLLCLLELEEAGSEVNSVSAADPTFLSDWKKRLPYIMDSDYQFVEPVLALRSSVLHSLLCRMAVECPQEASPPIHLRRRAERAFGGLTDTLLTQARLAREAGRYQVAEGALFTLKHLNTQRTAYEIPEALYSSLPYTLHLEEAKLYWERGEHPLAVRLLKSLLQTFTGLQRLPPEIASLYPTALSLYGNWLAETHSESPTIIMSSYLEKSVSLMEEQHSRDQPAVIQAYLALARFADTQYQRITRHMSSPAFEAKRQLLQKCKDELQNLESHLPAETRLKSRHVRTLQAQSTEDEIVMLSLLEDKQRFLEKALKNYILCLRTGDEHDLRVFRLCALWFANCSNININTIVKEGASQLESRKFLPLMYQLAARMSARTLATDLFQQTLQQIIHRTTLDHPYHCLYIILALSNASKDDKYPTSGHVTGTKLPGGGGGGGRSRLTKKNSTVTNFTVDEDKVKAASDLIVKLRSEKPSLVRAVEDLCGAYIDLAYHDVTAHRKQRGPIKLPSSCPLIKLAKLKEVAMPTMEIEVDPTCRYDNIVYIEGFDNCFQLAGGINLPKVLSCSGSDGKRRRQLVKGKDDLRQDAVMQQVFVLVNRLLRKEPATCKRRLSIRTYKVIPLSQRSGIVEWCEGTRPLGEYLIGPPQSPYQGAHYRYRPSDNSSMECRKKLMTAGNDRRGSKYQAYKEICERFQPVFHHFFMEYFSSPSEWFEKRLAYTRSVAASSIVGYVVGLGDRHVQNILIDTNTAELIHIDLGVAFEQGKTLPTPETVPFRLTRDLVDGMGIAGVEGVFRRCCEETMVVMRASHEELRTIVEVLLYDPLYLWTISPLKAQNLQRRADTDETNTSTTGGGDIILGDHASTSNGNNATNKMAERVLLRLQEKLARGIEDGVPLSVSGQVNTLIQEATDPANLCQLFPGWQPWI